MNKAVFVGSFDPITNGHLDIIHRASKLFDEIIIVLAINSEKKTMFSTEDRLAMLIKLIEEEKLTNVQYDQTSKMIYKYCNEKQIKYMVRGIRSNLDYEYEQKMFLYNKQLANNIDTVYLMSLQKNIHLSSTGIRELIRHNEDISAYVPKLINSYIKELNVETL